MLDVFFTVDVEIWCGGWKNIDEKFAEAFRRYIYGETPQGYYGLPYQLQLLTEHGVNGVFIVEPLFSGRFGLAPLQEIVGLIVDAAQEVQLHLHPEWVDEATEPLWPRPIIKTPRLQTFSLSEQRLLIMAAARRIEEAGGGTVNSFRAGGFNFDTNSLLALAACGIQFDSSYNASLSGTKSGVMPGSIVCEPLICNGVCEYPMTVFEDGTGSLRHVQLGACSFREMEGLLWRAVELERKAFVILSHNFELLNTRRDRYDPIVLKRMLKLLSFFDRNRDCFRLRGFKNLEGTGSTKQPEPLVSPLWKTFHRMIEQASRLRYG